MKTESPPAGPALSLQSKLDRIAHDRAVLALLRQLAHQGLREGDGVRCADDGTSGRVKIERRGESPPRIVVATEAGHFLPFDGARWQRD